MGVYIKGLQMPKSCLLCPFGDEFGKCCVNAELEDANELTHSCPLIELPDHGDLIDRDNVAELLGVADSCSDCQYQKGIFCENNWGEVCGAIYDDAKVIIPAERSEASPCDYCDQRNDKGCCVCKYIKERNEDATD